MHRSLLSAVLSLCVLFSTLVVAQDATYTFITLDVPGSRHTVAQGINTQGQIVGWYREIAVGLFIASYIARAYSPRSISRELWPQTA